MQMTEIIRGFSENDTHRKGNGKEHVSIYGLGGVRFNP